LRALTGSVWSATYRSSRQSVEISLPFQPRLRNL
jgi:hypothetical protein